MQTKPEISNLLRKATDKAYEYGCLRQWSEAYDEARRKHNIRESISLANKACGIHEDE